jgi:PTS hybrid protein
MDVERNSLVALVVVSHSAAIADGLAEVVSQVAGPDVAVLPVGGASDGSIGTDGAKVLAALREAAQGAGGVVLMDLGSSVLSVRAALDELAADERDRVVAVDAPLVEGAVAAGVIASTGATAAEVAAAAMEARSAVKL